ncbi:hypothetical protein [Pseudochelatococcus sp. G4_1912]|uniref:hypothetical protein n=1 Tax=Pseudochelatococcus sp. G4_1912 TaxID=3114288 RepID=UPI0039C5CDFE
MKTPDQRHRRLEKRAVPYLSASYGLANRTIFHCKQWVGASWPTARNDSGSMLENRYSAIGYTAFAETPKGHDQRTLVITLR